MIYIESKTFFFVENREGCSKFFVSRNNNDFTKMKYAHTQPRESDSYTFPLTNHGQKWVFTIQLRSPTQNLLCKKCNFVTGESSTRDEINYEGCAGPCLDISNIVKNVSTLPSRYIKLEEKPTSWGSDKARVIEIILFLDYSR